MRTSLRVSIFAALVALVGGQTPLATVAAHPLHPFRAFRARPAAAQLPKGFVLPAADVDVKVASVVATDVDADGDLDIVAAASGSGSPAILVWLNDGYGRLTRRRPAPVRTLGSRPAAPTIDRRPSDESATLQPDSPAIQATAARNWLTLPDRRLDRPGAAHAASATPGTLRSRSPPVTT